MSRLIIIILGFCVYMTAMADNVKDTIDYRQSTFKMAKWHIGPMAAMVRGKMDYNSDAFLDHAKAMAALSQLTPNGFSVESPAKNSRAKESIWKNRADFDSKVEGFQKASAELVTAAESGSLDTIKPAFAALADSCKACHSDYRLDKK